MVLENLEYMKKPNLMFHWYDLRAGINQLLKKSAVLIVREHQYCKNKGGLLSKVYIIETKIVSTRVKECWYFK